MQFRRLYGWGEAVQADMLSDKRRGAHPSPPKGREPDTHPQPHSSTSEATPSITRAKLARSNFVRLHEQEPVAFPQGRGARDKHLHVQADMLSACLEYKDMLSDKQQPTTYS